MYHSTSYFLIAVITISLLSHESKAQDAAPAAGGEGGDDATKLYPVDEKAYNVYKDKVCATIPQIVKGDDTPPKWQDDLNEDEVYELALLNLAYGLTTDATAHLPMSLGWKKELVDYMADITLKTCASSALSARFINGVKNLFLYYLWKLTKSPPSSRAPDDNGGNSTDPGVQNTWDTILSTVYTCGNSVPPIVIAENCGSFVSYIDAAGGAQPMMTVLEQVDREVGATPGTGFDIIIDSVWWMFSLTYARCYRFYYPNEDIILRFYAHFRDDFLTGLHSRWRGGGDNLDWFAIILGPVDVGDEWANLRKCASIAYDFEGMSGRQLVRPLMVTVENQIVKNFKVVPVVV